MNEGEIIEQGTYSTLMKRNGPLQELITSSKMFSIDDDDDWEDVYIFIYLFS